MRRPRHPIRDTIFDTMFVALYAAVLYSIVELTILTFNAGGLFWIGTAIFGVADILMAIGLIRLILHFHPGNKEYDRS